MNSYTSEIHLFTVINKTQIPRCPDLLMTLWNIPLMGLLNLRSSPNQPPSPPSAHSPEQVRPCWKMYWQQASHQVSSPPGSKVCPSPDSSFTLGSLSSGEKMVLTSGGLNPFFLLRGGPPPWPSNPPSAASPSPFLLSGLGKLSGGFTSGCPLSLQAGGCRRTALTTTAPLLALEIRILTPCGGHVASGTSRSVPEDLLMWRACTDKGESSVTEERVGTYFRPGCMTLNITHTPHSLGALQVGEGVFGRDTQVSRVAGDDTDWWPVSSWRACLLSVSRLRQSEVCRGTGWISFRWETSNSSTGCPTDSGKDSVPNSVHKHADFKFLSLSVTIHTSQSGHK